MTMPWQRMGGMGDTPSGVEKAGSGSQEHKERHPTDMRDYNHKSHIGDTWELFSKF